MINLDSVPVDITKQIHKFRDYLNVSWSSFLDIMDDHDWHDGTYPVTSWIQISWEIFVERVMLGKNTKMMSLNCGWRDSRMLNTNLTSKYLVIGRFEQNEQDHRTGNKIPQNQFLRLYSLISYDTINKLYGIGAPFEIAAFIDHVHRKDYYVPFDNVKFYLYPISVFQKRDKW